MDVATTAYLQTLEDIKETQSELQDLGWAQTTQEWDYGDSYDSDDTACFVVAIADSDRKQNLAVKSDMRRRRANQVRNPADAPGSEEKPEDIDMDIREPAQRYAQRSDNRRQNLGSTSQGEPPIPASAPVAERGIPRAAAGADSYL